MHEVLQPGVLRNEPRKIKKSKAHTHITLIALL